MKYLICGLNDENYTMPDFETSDTIENALKTAHNLCIDNAGDNYIYGDIITECKSIYPYEYRKIITYGDNNFYVTEIKPIKENSEYAAVWHHAYDGVDFNVIAEGTKEECLKVINNDIERVIDALEIDYYEDGDMTIDTGNEWEHWELVKL